MSIESQNSISIINYSDSTYPKLLKQIARPPKKIYIKGEIDNTTKCIAIVGSRSASTLVWAIVLIIVGIIGGGLGGLLVILGGLLGLVAALVKN